MGIKRIVDVSFWTDNKVVNSFDPEDRYFMIYIMTNPHTTQLGIYEINKRIMSFETGLELKKINLLIDKFEKEYKLIRFSEKTSEIAIKNYLRHSIVKGGKPVEDLLVKEIKKVNDKSLLSYSFNHLLKYDNLNETVKKIIADYFNDNDIQNDNDNDNDNDVSYHDSYHDSYTDSLEEEKQNNNDHLNVDSFFESVWELYPRKMGKSYIKKTQKEKLFKIGYDEIKRCIERYVVDQKNPDFYKHGSTFFNSGYIDYLDENFTEQKIQNYHNLQNNEIRTGQAIDLSVKSWNGERQ